MRKGTGGNNRKRDLTELKNGCKITLKSWKQDIIDQ